MWEGDGEGGRGGAGSKSRQLRTPFHLLPNAVDVQSFERVVIPVVQALVKLLPIAPQVLPGSEQLKQATKRSK